MGKIRVKTLGVDEVEKKQKQKSKQKAAEKRLVKGGKGGERIVAVGPSEEELAKIDPSVIPAKAGIQIRGSESGDQVGNDKKKKQKKIKKTSRSKSYQMSAKMVDRTKTYSLKDGLELLPKIHLASFDETIEMHINTTVPGISVTATLPHGTGKKIRVAIANDTIIENVAKGKIDFDVLLAEPAMMPKLARVAKFLGPRGLMPNPKNNTISSKPLELAKKYEAGQTAFKTEAKSPIMHIAVGKLSFGEKKLMENIKTVIDAIKEQNIKNITLKSTMSPGIKIQLA